MAIWTVVGPHFMQAACHKDIQISSLAIQCLHDCATALLNQQIELPHFHFNEALLKPFENLLCLELCDDDIQEQIISCICEFVETNRMEIRSGWRPLFNTLRAANNAKQYSAILEIFKVFLGTDNTLVFANAALDCILCLLSHIKGLHYDEVQPIENKPKKTTPTQQKPNLNLKFSKNSKFIPLSEEKSEKVIVDMCKEALFHLENCADILTIMYNMPKCPIFNTGNRINGDLSVSVVDPIIQSTSLDITNYVANENCEEPPMSYIVLSTTLSSTMTINSTLLKHDKPSNILKVWYVLIEGLISATVVCSKKNQPATMETLFKLLRNAIDVPGSHFGLHCINHILLPTVQNWLRQIANVNNHWDSVMPNFKQCCGLTTDTIVIYLHHLQQINIERATTDAEAEGEEENVELYQNPEVTFALKQIMLILVECIAQPQEPIARLGASCIRHIILTSGHLLTDHQWELVCTSLHRACNVSLTPLKQLTYAFKENSNSFYGDLAMVKVAARRDCSVNDNVRLHAMAQQVFWTDQTKDAHSKLSPKNSSQMLIDDRSYIFLIYLQESMNSLNPDLYTIRIPHRGLVVGLLAHQILIQIIATVLIQASSDVFQGINGILLESLKTGPDICSYKFSLKKSNADLLLKSLDISLTRAIQFDARPGLKFLVQKVSNLDHAANLYKQTTSSWLIKIITLTEAFFSGVQRYKLEATDISILIHNYLNTPKTLLQYDQFVAKMFDFKDTWELLCNSYVKHLISLSDFDEPDVVKLRTPRSSVDSNSSENQYNQIYHEEPTPIIENKNIISPPEETTKDCDNKIALEEKPKPFIFADFKTNSQSSEVMETVEEKSAIDEMEEEKQVSNDEDDDGKDEERPKKDRTIYYSEVCKASSTKEKINTSEVLDKHAEARKVNITIKDDPSHPQNKNVEPIIQPQPVPPEIEQQRTLSINKDAEVQRNCFQNVLMAYLELVLTFPVERFHVVHPVLQGGFLQLAKTVTEPQLLDRINLFFDKKDLSNANYK